MRQIITFLKNEDGPTTVEYAVMLMLTFLVVIGTIQLVGVALSGSFQESSEQIEEAITTNGV